MKKILSIISISILIYLSITATGMSANRFNETTDIILIHQVKNILTSYEFTNPYTPNEFDCFDMSRELLDILNKEGFDTVLISKLDTIENTAHVWVGILDKKGDILMVDPMEHGPSDIGTIMWKEDHPEYHTFVNVVDDFDEYLARTNDTWTNESHIIPVTHTQNNDEDREETTPLEIIMEPREMEPITIIDSSPFDMGELEGSSLS